MIQNWSAEEAKEVVVKKHWKTELPLHDFQTIIDFLQSNPSTEQRHEFITNRSWYQMDYERSDPDIASWVINDPYVPPLPPPAATTTTTNDADELRRSHRRKRRIEE